MMGVKVIPRDRKAWRWASAGARHAYENVHSPPIVRRLTFSNQQGAGKQLNPAIEEFLRLI